MDKDKGFPHFSGIDALFDEGIEMPDKQGIFKLTLPRLFKALAEGTDSILQFELPQLLESTFIQPISIWWQILFVIVSFFFLEFIINLCMYRGHFLMVQGWRVC